jgi:hypothetical protein
MIWGLSVLLPKHLPTQGQGDLKNIRVVNGLHEVGKLDRNLKFGQVCGSLNSPLVCNGACGVKFIEIVVAAVRREKWIMF